MRTRTTSSDGSLSGVSRYDFILAALPLPLLVGATVGAVTNLPTPLAVGTSGLLSVLLLGYGLFVASPTPTLVDRGGPVDDGDAGRSGRSRGA